MSVQQGFAPTPEAMGPLFGGPDFGFESDPFAPPIPISYGDTLADTGDMLGNIDTVLEENIVVELSPAEMAYGRRRDQLEAAFFIGGTEEQREEIVDQVASIGLPVDKIGVLARRPNDKGNETTLGSWNEFYGIFSVYELNDSQEHQERFSTIAHELAHVNSPNRPSNAERFGGEEKRLEAVEFVWAVTQQSLDTGKAFTGYHKLLMKRFNNKEIDEWTLQEETWAIMSELAITNRKKLEQVQDAQHAAIDRNPELWDREKVTMISHDDAQNPELAGVDTHLVQLMDGVEDHGGFVDHLKELKAKFYPDESLGIAIDRGTALLQYWLVIRNITLKALVEGDEDAPILPGAA